MAIKESTLTVANKDGSFLKIKIDDITDPEMKKDIENLSKFSCVKVRGKITKIADDGSKKKQTIK